jgi:predicted ferric reductase
MELQIKKEKTTTRAGQYIYINCPEISFFQWHPFTLTRYVRVRRYPVWASVSVYMHG